MPTTLIKKFEYWRLAEVACLFFLFSNVLDIESTIFALDQGLKEANPIVNEDFSLFDHWIFKIGICLMFFLPVYIFSRQDFFQVNYALWMFLASMFFMDIAFNNFQAGILKMWGY
jgi:hypothetical protein